MKGFKKFLFSFLVLITLIIGISCSKEEDVREPGDIVGVWKVDNDTYLRLNEDYIARVFQVVDQDGERIGEWHQKEVYFYEPGYNLVIYLTDRHEAKVYQIVELNYDHFVWCWVEDIDRNGASEFEDLGQIVGEIIKNAQEGYDLNPELYQNFTRESEEQFQELLDSLDSIIYI